MVSLPQQAQKVIQTLKNAGFQAYAVGGSVRDLLMGRTTKSWDFTTNAIPEEILKIFSDSFYDNVFGTVGIKIREDESDSDSPVTDIYEITTYRSEYGYTDHRHPDKVVWGKTLEEDLGRRDFTINAIAHDGDKIIDPYNGQKDIQDRIIRAVGDPQQRFEEDALRMMRAVRIATDLGFIIETNTLNAIKQNAKSLTRISFERIRDELLKILSAKHAADGILLLKNTSLLVQIIPELEQAFTILQKSPKRHHVYDVGTHSVMSLKCCPGVDPVIRLATLLHDIGKPKTFRRDEATGIITFYNHETVGAKIAKNICMRLKLSKKQIDKVVTLVRWHQFSVDERQTDTALRRFIRHVGLDNLDDILALRIGDRLGGGARETSWRLELFKKRLQEVQIQPFTVSDLKIDGYDVMKEFDIKPGPMVGKILNQIFQEVENGNLQNEREVLLEYLNKLRQSPSSANP